MAAVILDRRPTASADLAAFWTLVALGSATAVQKEYGVKPTLRDRVAAGSELADRLHGRAVQAVEFDTAEDVPCFILPEGTKVAIE